MITNVINLKSAELNTPLTEFLLSEIQQLFDITTTVQISPEDYRNNSQDSRNSSQKSFNPENFDKFEVVLDWQGVSEGSSYLELRNPSLMIIKNLQILSRHLKDKTNGDEISDLKSGIKKYFQGLISWSKFNNSEFKLYKNRIYNINFLLEIII